MILITKHKQIETNFDNIDQYKLELGDLLITKNIPLI